MRKLKFKLKLLIIFAELKKLKELIYLRFTQKELKKKFYYEQKNYYQEKKLI